MGPFFLFFLLACLFASFCASFFKKIDFYCLHKIVCLCFLHQQRSFVRCCCRVVVAVVVVSSGSLLKIVTIFCILLLLFECARCLLLLFALCSFASSCVFSHQFSVCPEHAGAASAGKRFRFHCCRYLRRGLKMSLHVKMLKVR